MGEAEERKLGGKCLKGVVHQELSGMVGKRGGEGFGERYEGLGMRGKIEGKGGTDTRCDRRRGR